MTEKRIITQICVVVHDVKKANANWAKILDLPEEKIETIFPDGILHYTHDQVVEYKDIQVAKYQLDNFVLELLQPDETPSPWRALMIARSSSKSSPTSGWDCPITLAITPKARTVMLTRKSNSTSTSA